jgi:hypothetical protein
MRGLPRRDFYANHSPDVGVRRLRRCQPSLRASSSPAPPCARRVSRRPSAGIVAGAVTRRQRPSSDGLPHEPPPTACHRRPPVRERRSLNCPSADAVEHGERAAKPEIGESIPCGEFGPCDPRRFCRPLALHYTWRMPQAAIRTRRVCERSESMRRDDFPPCGRRRLAADNSAIVKGDRRTAQRWPDRSACSTAGRMASAIFR